MEPQVAWLALLVAVGGWILSILLFLWERRSRRNDVRAAEKRARVDKRLEPVWRYAKGLQGFVVKAAQFMSIWEQVRESQVSRPGAEELAHQLDAEWDLMKELEPSPAWNVVVEDFPAQTALAGLEMVANGCRARCQLCLKTQAVVPGDELGRWLLDSEGHVKLLRDRVASLVEHGEP